MSTKSCSGWRSFDATFSHLSQNCAISRPSSSVTSSRPVSFPFTSTPSHDDETTPNNACSITSDSEKEEVRTTGGSSNRDKLDMFFSFVFVKYFCCNSSFEKLQALFFYNYHIQSSTFSIRLINNSIPFAHLFVESSIRIIQSLNPYSFLRFYAM